LCCMSRNWGAEVPARPEYLVAFGDSRTLTCPEYQVAFGDNLKSCESVAAAAPPTPPLVVLIAKNLDHEPLRAAAVELGIEDLLPWAEVELTVGHR
jgi:hypothetical protein